MAAVAVAHPDGERVGGGSLELGGGRLGELTVSSGVCHHLVSVIIGRRLCHLVVTQGGDADLICPASAGNPSESPSLEQVSAVSASDPAQRALISPPAEGGLVRRRLDHASD